VVMTPPSTHTRDGGATQRHVSIIEPGHVIAERYEVRRLLGRGGMGEVWLAQDTRLGRFVAIKTLPPELSVDTARRARFEREAKAISALSHPNICTLYDVGEQNRVDYLILEYIDGVTLADVMKSGPLSVDRVLRYGIDIAAALEEAHKNGIVHRDLKPANVMVTKSCVKLLDFGLAKWLSPPTLLQLHDTGSATAKKPVTHHGQIIGTLTYMAPEQLEGREADERTDMFAFGTLLYLLATGTHPFEGPSDAAVMAAILKSEPKPLLETRPSLPPPLASIIEKCLEKDPDARWQSVHDVREQLRSLEVASRDARGFFRYGLAATVIVAVAIASLLGFKLWSREAAVDSERVQLQPPPGIRLLSGVPGGNLVAMSPDGKWIAFRATSRDRPGDGLYLRSTTALEARLVAEGENSNPSFSPDSKWLLFFGNGALQKVPVAGGDPVVIYQGLRHAQATWGDDGTILFANRNRLWRVSSRGGTREAITAPRKNESHWQPRLLPGAEKALLVIDRGESDSFRTIALLSLRDRTIQPLTSGNSPRYSDGHLVFGRDGSIYIARIDLKRGRMLEGPRPVITNVHHRTGGGITAFDVASNGSIVYVPTEPDIGESDIVWLSRSGDIEPIAARRGAYGAMLSPDARLIAIVLARGSEDADIWIYEIARRSWQRITTGSSVGGPPVWSPDGQHIYFSSFVSGKGNLYRVRTDGSSAPERLTSGANTEYVFSAHPSGRTLMFIRDGGPRAPGEHARGTRFDLMVLPLDALSAPSVFLAANGHEAFPTFCPDGRWVAYESFETGQREVHVRPYPGPGQRVMVSIDGGGVPFWSRDGRELFYRKDKEIWVAPVSLKPTFRAGTPQRLFHADFLDEDPWANAFDVSMDGKKILTVRPRNSYQGDRQLVYIRNWLSELNSGR
jgi:eukaryotic-like serine/threonine-protein kinase